MIGTVVSRREFIKLVSIASGGLVLGFRLPARVDASSDTAAGAEWEPNAWLRIGNDGLVTVVYGRAEMGQGSSTALAMIVADELDADWKDVRFEQADAHPTLYGNMTTGGSRSVRGFWTELRTAGATAKEMLLLAAAGRWAVDKSSCRAEKSVVRHASGKTLTYAELAEDAAKLEIPKDVPLKERKDFTLIGTRTPRLDTVPKVYAQTKFCSDMTVPGMLTASIERCPSAGGKAVRFDATKALQIQGVKEVITTDSGVAVVAHNTWAAMLGRSALSVEWDPGPWADQSSEKIWERFGQAAASTGTVREERGDFQAAYASAATKVEAVYRAPFVAHATMEPMVCIADVRADRCEIWAPTQSPQGAQTTAAEILGLPVERVTVHVAASGGGFGRRLQSDFVADAVRVSKAVGAPIKVVWTREDDMKHDWYRPGTYNLVKAGLDERGRPIAWMHRIVGPDSPGLVLGGSTPPYELPNLVVDHFLIDTGVRVGAWRSVGPSQNAFVIESTIDELAHAAKRDPFEFRRSLLGGSLRLRRALESAAEKSSWSSPPRTGMARGIAAVESFGTAVAQVAEVSVNEGRLTIHRIVTALDCGPYVNPDTIEQQVEGAVVMALGAALKDEITLQDGRVSESNFHDYRLMTIADTPRCETYIIETDEPVGGIGEPPLPPVAPAVCNAIFAATGVRVRRLPFTSEDLVRS